MRLSIVRDGKRSSVEVDPATSTVLVGSRRFPYRLLVDAAGHVELEIGGEKVVVDGWPSPLPEPAGPVDVNGERWRVSEIRAEEGGGVRTAVAPRAPELRPAEGVPGKGVSTPTSVAVLPPMPGKIVEVRVHLGDRVEKGQVLLVLEAMKMRNEITSPSAGRIVELAVSAGSNVRARETMVRIEPD